MSQTQQIEELEAFAESVFLNLVLASLKRKLTDDEATSFTWPRSSPIRAPTGQFSSRAKLSRERRAFEQTTASLRQELRGKKIRGLATRIALTGFVLSLTAACLMGCVQPLEGNAYHDTQQQCLNENRCWRLTKSMFFDVEGIECGDKLKYPLANYWHESDFDIGVNCNQNDEPRYR